MLTACLPRMYLNEPAHVQHLRSARDGFYGWQGFGGSVMQWHPGLDIGFGYAPTLLAWYAESWGSSSIDCLVLRPRYDPVAKRGAELQREVVKCASKAAAADEGHR